MAARKKAATKVAETETDEPTPDDDGVPASLAMGSTFASRAAARNKRVAKGTGK